MENILEKDCFKFLDELSAFNPRMSVLMHLDVVWGLVSFEILSWALKVDSILEILSNCPKCN
jgi:hypothetical protein